MKVICQTWFVCSHTIHSLKFFKRDMTSFWPKRRSHSPATVPTHAATSRVNSRPMEPTSPLIRKQCIPSLPARHTRKGSCPLRSESPPRNPFQPRPSRAQSTVTTGRDQTKFRGVWVSTLTVRALTGVVVKIQSRPRPWDPTALVVTSTP